MEVSLELSEPLTDLSISEKSSDSEQECEESHCYDLGSNPGQTIAESFTYACITGNCKQMYLFIDLVDDDVVENAFLEHMFFFERTEDGELFDPDVFEMVKTRIQNIQRK